MLKIKNGGLDQYGAEPFEQQQFGTDGVQVVKRSYKSSNAFFGVSTVSAMSPRANEDIYETYNALQHTERV